LRQNEYIFDLEKLVRKAGTRAKYENPLKINLKH